MEPVGRAAELREIDVLLEAAAAGSGGVLNFFGPAGSGKTMLIGAAARRARSRGFEVLGAAAVRGQPGRLLWAQLLTDAGADEEAAMRLRAIGLPRRSCTKPSCRMPGAWWCGAARMP